MGVALELQNSNNQYSDFLSVDKDTHWNENQANNEDHRKDDVHEQTYI